MSSHFCLEPVFSLGTARLEVLQGDITTLQVDAIVNAANSSLLGGGGVDGAIHAAAGPELRTYCRTLGGCPTGEVRLSPGFNLPARHIIHTVGPIWAGGGADEDELLAACYAGSLRLAAQNGFSSIAFPAISTGIYGFPPERAAPLVTRVVLDHLEQTGRGARGVDRIIFCCFSSPSAKLHHEALAREDRLHPL
ncbi:O-acetyl-ADP-ribose deacetylase [Xanthobacter sp. TB0136]|uniref:O-acetyl-ADP-ribose deacetylase n=1 Tax=Xanthobacter sp. TB0136 TaxID=3459177 RepID=UPI00403A00CB